MQFSGHILEFVTPTWASCSTGGNTCHQRHLDRSAQRRPYHTRLALTECSGRRPRRSRVHRQDGSGDGGLWGQSGRQSWHQMACTCLRYLPYVPSPLIFQQGCLVLIALNSGLFVRTRWSLFQPKNLRCHRLAGNVPKLCHQPGDLCDPYPRRLAIRCCCTNVSPYLHVREDSRSGSWLKWLFRLCAGVTVYSALRKSNTQSGQWVVLLGAGGGMYSCQPLDARRSLMPSRRSWSFGDSDCISRNRPPSDRHRLWE